MATPAQLSEKARIEQDLPRAPTPSLEQPPRGRQNAPPLPPRLASVEGPPRYNSADARRSHLISEQWRSKDPRSSSTHSLVPPESGRHGRDGRRTLLLVYIHGFMGNETSFQSFPAHVHNLLTITLDETHVIHTKIYPRYKSRKAIEFARDDFSTWLQPHEDPNTDVILITHSMGGILGAEIVLKPSPSPATGKAFQHLILGTINVDVPFLGMHPGVMSSGIGSLFRPAPEPPKPHQPTFSGTNTPSADSQASASSPALSRNDPHASSQLSMIQSINSAVPPTDPFFNPPFPNDVRLAERKGWSNVLHFINKHSDGATVMTKLTSLTSATGAYFMSHIEFGGCLADFPALKNRYDRVRALEDDDELANGDGLGYRPLKRQVRFVNYYTASTGRPKAPKSPKSPKVPPGQVLGEDGQLRPIEVEMQNMALSPSGEHLPSTPNISVDDYSDGAVTPQRLAETPDASPMEFQMQDLGQNSGVQNDVQELPEMRHVDSMPVEDNNEALAAPVTAAPEQTNAENAPNSSEPALHPIPPMPTEPSHVDLDAFTDKDARKIADKEQKRVLKAYQQAIKDRENAIKDRKKFVEKREKKARQEQEKQQKADEKQRLKEQKEEEKRKATINPETETRERQASMTSSTQDAKPKRDKKFCMLPPERGGKRDRCWIRVYMEGVDEVGAHTGLFLMGPQYESLVMDVGERVKTWVLEAAEKRAILERRGGDRPRIS